MARSRKTVVPVPGIADSASRGYVQCIRAGDLVFVAGQTGVDENYRAVSLEFGPQMRQAMKNLQLALEAAGASLRDVVAMTGFITDMRYANDFRAIRKEIMGGELTSALIGVESLAQPVLLVEIQAIAVGPD